LGSSSQNLLLPEDFLKLADLFLNLSSYTFTGALAFEVRIADDLARLLFDGSLHLVHLAREIVFGALFHPVLLASQLPDDGSSRPTKPGRRHGGAADRFGTVACPTTLTSTSWPFGS
jgi:hypothetical protein